MENVHTVSSLTELVRQTLVHSIPYVWVRGEITNFSRAASGHIYFAVKDASSQLQCVWFARRQTIRNFDPLTGEVFSAPPRSAADSLKNGVEILCGGSMEVYAARGQYQLIIDQVQPAGCGLLALEFEQRKRKLADAGYFEQARKRALPCAPMHVAVITSPRGAAIHDFIELANNRGSGNAIRIYPVQVQGAGAAEKMAEAISRVNTDNWAEVIVLIRGGGSLEDLWAFNEEVLANAIFSSRLPVLAGVGHEVDFTLADLTADVRASTPSHAAQLLWPLRSELWQTLDSLQLALERNFGEFLSGRFREHERLSGALDLLSPGRQLQKEQRQLASLARSMRREIARVMEQKSQRYLFFSQNLPDLRAISDKLAFIADKVGERSLILREQASRALQAKSEKIERLTITLNSFDPAEPLRRGYAILYDANGLAQNCAALIPGQNITAYLRDGSAELKVMAVRPGQGLTFGVAVGETGK